MKQIKGKIITKALGKSACPILRLTPDWKSAYVTMKITVLSREERYTLDPNSTTDHHIIK